MTSPSLREAAPSRFHEKQRDILAAATTLMNQNGVKGMTLTKVADAIGLNTTSVTYYYKRKEMLAEAILADAIGRYAAVAEGAAQEGSPRLRLGRMVNDTLTLYADIRQGNAPPIANLSHIQVLGEPSRQILTSRYLELLRFVRSFLTADDPAPAALMTARTHVLLENLFWAQAWLTRYSIGDFARVSDRLTEVLSEGIVPEGVRWQPQPLEIEEPVTALGRGGMGEAFLRSATRLMNERGYRGASVELIAGELSVTKGSFYHHLQSKDELVLACFDMSYGRVSLTQRAAQSAQGSHGEKLSSAVLALLQVQFLGDAPLLRTTALSALPPALRSQVIARSNRMARRFAGMLIDGITEGSVKAVDPLITAQVIMASLNTAFELRRWASRRAEGDAIPLYASILEHGMIDTA
ncbi:MAG: TetR family transcriptional regulator [Parvularcula sp.]|jgi:AcrR family transcriptional regulator|nr:TetR family transcriptional regulator [Parvularcula sp.]